MKKVLRSKESLLMGLIIIVMIIISCANPVFWRLDNLMDILKNCSVLGIVACGMLLVILTGGIDVSVGAITAACACIVGTFLINVSSNIVLALLCGVACGLFIGLVNGILITRVNLPPIVATLGVYNIVNGIVKYMTNGTWITGIPDNFIAFGQISWFQTEVEGINKPVGLPIQVVFLAVVAVLTYLLLKYTRFGRSVYAIGGSRVSAERIGYNVKRTEMLIYAFVGGLSGVASLVHTSIYRQVDPGSFAGFEIDVIAAVIIGGTDNLGGYGSVQGVMLGVIFVTVLNNGLILMRIPTFWQQIVTGLVIVFAVGINAYSRYMSEKNTHKVDVENE